FFLLMSSPSAVLSWKSENLFSPATDRSSASLSSLSVPGRTAFFPGTSESAPPHSPRTPPLSPVPQSPRGRPAEAEPVSAAACSSATGGSGYTYRHNGNHQYNGKTPHRPRRRRSVPGDNVPPP